MAVVKKCILTLQFSFEYMILYPLFLRHQYHRRCHHHQHHRHRHHRITGEVKVPKSIECRNLRQAFLTGIVVPTALCVTLSTVLGTVPTALCVTLCTVLGTDPTEVEKSKRCHIMNDIYIMNVCDTFCEMLLIVCCL